VDLRLVTAPGAKIAPGAFHLKFKLKSAIITKFVMGLISFDAGTFTSFLRRSIHARYALQVSLTANFVSKVKAAFSMPSFAPAYA